MKPELIYKVLNTLHQNKDLLIPKSLLGPLSGFAKLRKQHYIKIEKAGDGIFKATLTNEGLIFITTFIPQP